MTREEEQAAALLGGRLPDAAALRALGSSPDGQKVRSMLGSEQELSDAIRRGDTAVLQKAMQTLLSTEEGRRFFGRLGGMLGGKKPNGRP